MKYVAIPCGEDYMRRTEANFDRYVLNRWRKVGEKNLKFMSVLPKAKKNYEPGVSVTTSRPL